MIKPPLCNDELKFFQKDPFDTCKFIYSEKATKFCEIFPLLLTVCTAVKSKGKISQNFVAFSEYMNFKVEKQKSKGRNKKWPVCIFMILCWMRNQMQVLNLLYLNGLFDTCQVTSQWQFLHDTVQKYVLFMSELH